MENPCNAIQSRLWDLQESYERRGEERASKGKEFHRAVDLCEANIAYFSLTPRPDDSSPIRFRLASLGTRIDPEPGTVNPLPIWKWILRLIKDLKYDDGLAGGLYDETQALFCIYRAEPTSLSGYQSDVFLDSKSHLLPPEQREKLGAINDNNACRLDRLTDPDLAKKLWHSYYREFPREVASKVEIELSKVEDVPQDMKTAEPIRSEPSKEDYIKPIGEAEMSIVVASSDETIAEALRKFFPISNVASVTDDSVDCALHVEVRSAAESERATYRLAEKQLKYALDQTSPFSDKKIRPNVFFAVGHDLFKEKLLTGDGCRVFGRSCILGQVLLKPGVWLVLEHCWTPTTLLCDGHKVNINIGRKDSEEAELIRSFMLPQIKKCY
jgi:hypothetical protein